MLQRVIAEASSQQWLNVVAPKLFRILLVVAVDSAKLRISQQDLSLNHWGFRLAVRDGGIFVLIKFNERD